MPKAEEKIWENVVQGCTIRRTFMANHEGKYKLECLTCNQLACYEDQYQQGKAAGFHFADKEKYPIS